jgi:ABC-type phosphate/phosphonate transport system substrate-binding protein
MTTAGRRRLLTGEAGLGMYPFPELRPAYDAYWAAVHRRAPWLPPVLTWHADLHASWRAADLVVGYTCGWPLVTELAERVQVLGTFEFDIPEADGHRYRSVLIARDSAPLESFAGARAAANSPDSLSGWVSLITAVHGAGGTWTGPVRWTGAHVDSVRAVRLGEADVASIDSVTWHHVLRFAPEIAVGVVTVGAGPLVPCLPVVAGAAVPPDALAEIREAMADAFVDPDIVGHSAMMLTRAFVPLDLADYLPLLELAPAG